MKHSKELILVLITVFFILGNTFLSPNWIIIPVTPHYTSCQYEIYTFADLGYNTTTYRHNQHFYLQINCTGSSMSYYTVKIYLHATGYRMAVRYIVNGGVLYDYPIGMSTTPHWGNLSIAPGQFVEGSNTFKFDNVALNADPEGYVTFFADSYIEIFHENDTETTTNPSLTSPKTTQVGEEEGIELFIRGLILGIFVTIGAVSLYKVRDKRKGKLADNLWIKREKTPPPTPPRTTTLGTVKNKEPTQYHVRHPFPTQECSICRGEITPTDPLAICPYCQNRFHRPHFEETLKMKGKCPICQQEIMRNK